VLLADIESDAPKPRVKKRFLAFSADYAYAPFRHLAALQLSRRWSWRKPDEALAVWDALAGDPDVGHLADAAAARVLYAESRYDAAASRFEKAFQAALDAGEHPTVDYAMRQAILASRGEVGWKLFWARWRARVLQSSDPTAALSFVETITQLGGHQARGPAQDDDVGRVVAALKGKPIEDPALVSALAGYLIQTGRTGEAWAVLKPQIAAGKRADPALLETAAALAEHDGRNAEAVGYITRAMEALAGEPIALETLRLWHRKLIDLHRRMALAADRPERASQEIAAALAVAAAWRREDPDNSEIDKLCAATLFAAGQPEQAQRHLSSIIERHPAEGQAYADVADALEGQGIFADADALWVRAIEVEPTNPTWLIRRAQNRLAAGGPGEEAAARDLLTRIDKGTWQDRFSNVVDQARSFLKGRWR
jgi:tetratricopeptide (TPR) repeat protein